VLPAEDVRRSIVLVNTGNPKEPSIRGSAIRDAREWARNAYGPEAFQAALSKLSVQDRALIEGPILHGSWYPIESWDRFLAAMRVEAKARRGHSEHEFNMRNLRESGPAIVRGAYKFLLGLLSPQSVIEKAVLVFNRLYSEGRFELVKNEPHVAVVRYRDASPDFRTNVRNHFPTGFIFLLELNRAKNVDGRISRDEIVDGKLVMEVTLSYE
jgi:hypothetical protein